jgi:hypothetical protein
LLDGLLGSSIGSISKDVRFYLDQLCDRFPDYFQRTVVDVDKKKSVVTGHWQKYKRDLMKWRWKIIKKAEESKASAAADDGEDERLLPEHHIINKPAAEDVDEANIVDPLDEEDYIIMADDEMSDDDSPTAARFGKSMAYEDENDDEEDERGEKAAADDGQQESDISESDTETAPKKKRKSAATKQRKQPSEMMYIPSKKQQKKVLGYNVSSSSNTDLYSTDEERLGKHKERDEAMAEEDIPWQGGMDSYQHCSKCIGPFKIPHIVFEISADGVVIQKRAVKSASWPLMGQILYISPCKHLQNKVRFYLPRNSQPVIIGFYHGTTKPDCANSYLKCIFKEMRLAEKRGLCTMFLKFYIGDGPSRQFIKGFPSSTAYCGCERLVASNN